MELAKAKGITIIPVPFWWDERPERYGINARYKHPY